MERIFTFNSTAALRRFCDSAPVASQWLNEFASKTGSSSFCKSASWDDAQNLIVSGAADIVKKLSSNLDSISRRAGDVARVSRGVVGFAPCVPAALAGRPDSMYNRRKTAAPAPVVNLYYNSTFDCRIKAETIIEIGSYVLAAVRDLESRGVRVNLYSCAFSESRGHVGGLVCRIKSAGDAFSLAAVSYPLAHPSFLRRHYFRCLESCEEPQMKLSGYGAVKMSGLEKYLPAGALVVPGASFVGNPAGVLDYIKKGLK